MNFEKLNDKELREIYCYAKFISTDLDWSTHLSNQNHVKNETIEKINYYKEIRDTTKSILNSRKYSDIGIYSVYEYWCNMNKFNDFLLDRKMKIEDIEELFKEELEEIATHN